MKNVMMINQLRIKYDKKADSLSEAYSVWTPDGKCWEDRLTLNQAVAYCQDTKDFVIRPISKDSILYLQKWIKITDLVRDSIGRHLKRYPYLRNITAYYKDLRYVDGIGYVITKERIESLSIMAWVQQKAKELMQDPDYTTQIDY